MTEKNLLSHKVLWIGGPPSNSFANLKAKYARIGFEIVEKWEQGHILGKTKIPANVTLVFINRDMSQKTEDKHMQMLANDGKIGWCYTANSFTVGVTNLRDRGLITDATASEAYQNVAVEKLDPHSNDSSLKETKQVFEMETMVREKMMARGFTGERLDRVVKFYWPEIETNNSKVKDYFKNYAADKPEIMQKMLLALLNEDNINVSTLARKIVGISNYYVAVSYAVSMAALGYVERVGPYTSENTVRTGCSFSVRMTPEGRIAARNIQNEQAKQRTMVDMPTVTAEPVTVAPVAEETVVPSVQVHAPEVMMKPAAPTAPTAPTPTTSNAFALTNSMKPHADLKTVVAMVIDTVREQHPDIETIHINVQTRKMSVEYRRKDEFDV